MKGFDFKKVLDHSGVFLSVAEMARDGIVQRINQSLQSERDRVLADNLDLKFKLTTAQKEIKRLNALLELELSANAPKNKDESK